MARGNLTIQTLEKTSGTQVEGAGVTEAAMDATDGNKFLNDGVGKYIILLRNKDTDPHNVVVDCPRTVDGLAVGDLTITCLAEKTFMWGPFSRDVYNQLDGTADNDYVYLKSASNTIYAQVFCIS